MQTIAVHVNNLSIDTFNPRRTVDAAAIRALADNIHANGVLSPLLVRPALENIKAAITNVEAKYTVLCGSRRLQASKDAGLSSVPVVVRELTDAQAAEVALTEQDAHESLHYLERAEAYARWHQAGVSAEDIAEKMKQSRATVYAILGLNSLTAEAKKACAEGRIPETTARDLGSVPPELQGQALKKLSAPGISGEKLSTREMKEIIASFRIDLEKVSFDISDAGLVQGVGACKDCPFRSGNRLELYGEAKSEWLCTNPPCAQRKADSAWNRRVDDGEHNRGPRCLNAKAAERIFDDRGQLRDDVGYVAADAVCHQDMAQRPYASLIGRGAEKHYELARSPKTGAVVQLINRAVVDTLMDEAGKIRRRPTAAPKADQPEPEKLSKEEKARLEEKRQLRAEAKRRIIAAIVAKVEKREPDKALWRMLADTLFNQGAVDDTLQRRDVQEKPSTYLGRLSEAQLRGFVFEGTMEYELYGDGPSEKYPEGLKKAAELFGVEIRAIETEVAAEARAKPKITKAKEGR